MDPTLKPAVMASQDEESPGTEMDRLATELGTIDFDDVLEELGEFGPYQKVTYLLLCLPVFFTATNNLAYVFTAGVPNYRCYVPGCDNTSSPSYAAPWLQDAIPPSTPDGVYIPAQCSMYSPMQNYTDLGECPIGQFSDDVVGCDTWVFDNEWTIVGEFNITCHDNLWKLSLAGTVQFSAILVGAVFFGYLGDRFGRKTVLVPCILLTCIAGIGKALSRTYITFLVNTFINGLGLAGIYPLAYILGIELVGSKKREMFSIVLNYFYSVGEASVALIAWLSKDWKVTQLTVSVPCALFVVYFWVLPESVRWFLAQGRLKEAISTIKTAAKRNHVVLSPRVLNKFIEIEVADNQNDVGVVSVTKNEVMGIGALSLQILKNRKLCLRSLELFFTWAATAFVYYGLSLNSTYLGGDKYLNFVFVCLIEIPGFTLSWFSLRRFGRRKTLFCSLLLSSVTCISAALVPIGVNWAKTLLFLLGKLAISCTFGTIYVYTAELYPTVMRSAGVGLSSTVGRIGSMVAPFAALLGSYNSSLPLFLFGAVALLAALLSLLYPETRGRKLPETLDDLKRLK